MWWASFSVPDDCEESREGYEFYSLTFYCTYKKPIPSDSGETTTDATKLVAKEIQKIFNSS